MCTLAIIQFSISMHFLEFYKSISPVHASHVRFLYQFYPEFIQILAWWNESKIQSKYLDRVRFWKKSGSKSLLTLIQMFWQNSLYHFFLNRFNMVQNVAWIEKVDLENNSGKIDIFRDIVIFWTKMTQLQVERAETFVRIMIRRDSTFSLKARLESDLSPD